MEKGKDFDLTEVKEEKGAKKIIKDVGLFMFSLVLAAFTVFVINI